MPAPRLRRRLGIPVHPALPPSPGSVQAAPERPGAQYASARKRYTAILTFVSQAFRFSGLRM
ncbi:hypothetical protein WQQ_22400 [Hydrocarboniphaga effusa AP103]|uniref:Uncharacterized protein n=1 Tax=Hydrocarboniphaga effusa AP103 TaxID=1172194 RepID=I8TEI2_9GAMM|nr:hypothetical protein WQQ_22400 [Hydrocarboniphaga effusa AP103]